MPPWSPISVGERIRHVRHVHGLSQSELARKCGFSVTALSGWENGRVRPSIGFAANIIDEFDLTLDYLLLGRMATLRHSVAVHLNEGESGLKPGMKPGTKREAKS